MHFKLFSEISGRIHLKPTLIVFVLFSQKQTSTSTHLNTKFIYFKSKFFEDE